MYAPEITITQVRRSTASVRMRARAAVGDEDDAAARAAGGVLLSAQAEKGDFRTFV
jgi:hypothetical protein